ncbi:hypothetical protein GCM10010207_69600 [Streptomyces atratus]|nr:hypothetical protein GCM10010207_69600 [Streptomyces atratus]
MYSSWLESIHPTDRAGALAEGVDHGTSDWVRADIGIECARDGPETVLPADSFRAWWRIGVTR